MENKKPLFTTIEQLGFVVKSVKETLKLLCDEYGIGPWLIVRFGPDGKENCIPIEEVVLEGEDIGSYETIVAVCDLPNGVQLELIEPVSGRSLFADYLETHGPGLQHISVSGGSDYDEAIERIAAVGRARGQTAVIDKTEMCAFMDHKDVLGTYLELHKRPEDFALPNVTPEFYPPGNKMPEGCTPLFTYPDQLGILVEDLDKALKVLWDDYGIGPWILIDFGPTGKESTVSVENASCFGRSVEPFAVRAAICESLNMQLEVMQAVNFDNVYGIHVKKHGSDLQHLSLIHPEGYDKTVARMAAAGYDQCQLSTVDYTETCNYCDHTDILGIYLESHKRPENFQPPAVELETYPPGMDIGFGQN